MRPHRRQPTRLPHPWDSPGKNTGAGCHSLLQCVKVKSLSRVRLLATPWTAAYQAPPSMGFSRQEYWGGVPLPSPKQIYGDGNQKSGCFDEVIWFLLLSCRRSLHILDINFLSDICLENIFFHYANCLFISLIIFFTLQKFFHLMWSLLSILVFVAYAFGVISKKSLSDWRGLPGRDMRNITRVMKKLYILTGM